MGFLDLFNSTPTTPSVDSVLPVSAKSEILSHKLPSILNTNLFLKNGEVCHYYDNAIYEKATTHKKYVKNSSGISMPGIFTRNRIRFAEGAVNVKEEVTYKTYNGVLYITNKRIIFVDDQEGFTCNVSDITAATPYSNCIELQFNTKTYKLFVPDGALVQNVLQMIV